MPIISTLAHQLIGTLHLRSYKVIIHLKFFAAIISLTEEQVSQLAPDAASLKSGKDLSKESKWLNFQCNERSIWGEMQGSGKDPYRTQVDIGGMAFKCSCPSRKFPCKHGLGLLFLYSQKSVSFKQDVEEPLWVSEWMNKRTEKAEKKAAEPEEVTPEKADKREKDKEKRDNERLMKVQAGAAELELWIKDLIRTGLISLPEKGSQFFSKTAARMIDQQVKGLANMVRELGEINYYNGTAWHSQALEQICKIYALLEAFKNIDNLPPAVQEDVRTMIGWNQSQKELADDEQAEMLQDNWLVIGRKTSTEEDITVQRNWLYGCTSGRYAFVLNFGYKSVAIQTQLMPGMVSRANVVFFPSNMPFRAFVKAQTENQSVIKYPLTPIANWDQANQNLTDSKKLFFWTEDMPQYVGNLSLVPHNNIWYLKDSEGAFLKLHNSFSNDKIWNLLAVSGDKPINLFLLRNPEGAMPLGYIEGENYKLL